MMKTLMKRAVRTIDDNDDDDNKGEDDNLKYIKEMEGNFKVNELQILYNAALILQNKLKEMPKLNLPWPPLASDLTLDNVKKVVPCELFNVLA